MLQTYFFDIECNEHYIMTLLRKRLIKINNYSDSDRKIELIDITWNYLLKQGIGHSSVGELCRDTGVAQSSLYHYFENKDDIWISAGKYGIAKVVDALFDFTLKHTGEIPSFFAELLDEVEKYKYDLRLGIQITTSPVFGERMRSKADEFHFLYESFANKLSDIVSCSYIEAETFIYSIIAYVIDYAIWDDREKTQMLLDNLYERTVIKLNK